MAQQPPKPQPQPPPQPPQPQPWKPKPPWKERPWNATAWWVAIKGSDAKSAITAAIAKVLKANVVLLCDIIIILKVILIIISYVEFFFPLPDVRPDQLWPQGNEK